MRPPSERTTPTLGVEISGFFPPVTLKSYYSVLVDRYRQIGDVLHLIIGLDLLDPADRKLVPARFGDVERRHLVIAPAKHRHHLRFRALRIGCDLSARLAHAVAVFLRLVDAGEPRKLLELCRP